MTRHKFSEHHYGGWSPSPPDIRDHLAAINPPSTILPEVDPRTDPHMPWIYDQGQLGSCTSNAVAAALQYNHGVVYGPKARRPSRLDIYYGERSLEGSLGQGDTGANGRDGFKFAQQTGYLLETAWPYDITTFENPPPSGIRHKLLQSYATVPQTQVAIQTALSNKQTVAFGFTVYDSFESQSVADTGVVPMPGFGEGVLGGHEILAIGYLASDPDHVLCRNSWGEGWGLAGYCLMPWKYLCNPSLASDLRTIVRSA